jgi:hypothetical protein
MKSRYSIKLLSKIASSILFFTLFSTSIEAQKYTFGKPNISEFDKIKFEDDTTTKAIVLYDSALTCFSAIREQFTIITNYFKRIKIISDDGVNEGTIVIQRRGGEYFEKYEPYLKVEGFSYRKGKDNQIISTPLDSNDVFITANTIKIVFPRVKKGSIIEYNLIMESPASANLFGWRFMDNNPVIKSTFRIEIPEYFNVAAITNGKTEIKIQKLTDTLYSSPKKQTSFFKELGSTSKINVKRINYSLENLQGINDENYIHNEVDLIPSISFHLYELRIDDFYRKFIDTWIEYSNKYCENDNLQFGKNRIERLKGYFHPVIQEGLTDREKINTLVRYTKDNIQWDGNKSERALTDVFKTIDLKKGNSADINLVLIALLKANGYDAHPVIISSRGNGEMNVQFPNEYQLNQMVVGIRYNDNWVFRDATNKYLNDDLLPLEAYNGNALIPMKDNPLFVDLSTDLLQMSEKTHHEIKVDQSLKVKIKAEITLDLFTSAYFRKLVDEKKSKNGLRLLLEQSTLHSIDSLAILNKDDYQEALKLAIFKTISSDSSSNKIEPFFIGQLNNNPFKTPSRFNNITFPHPLKEIITTAITFEGFSPKFKVPVKKLTEFSQRGIVFQYESSFTENQVNIMSRRLINRTTYNATDYAEIKAYFAYIIEKQHEAIEILP